MSAIKFEASEMLPAATVKNVYCVSTSSYCIGPQGYEIPVAVEIDSEAKAKVCEVAGKVTLLDIAGSELKVKEITVEGQGS